MNIQKRRGGFYWDGKTPYLSVTTILKCIDKPALMYWFGREVYRAMLIDPSMVERDALAAPYKTSTKAKDRGSTVHSIVEAFKNTGEQIEIVDPAFRGYATAFYDFMRDFKADLLEQEKTVMSVKLGIAGTLDIYAKIGDLYYLIDVKTGKDVYQEAGLQLSAYKAMMVEEGKQVDRLAVLLLETGADNLPTGNYKFQTMTDDIEAFMACKKLYCYLNTEQLLKVGYTS